MTTPAIRVLFVIFIGKQRGTRATMQVEGHDIRGGEPILWEMGEKEFVDRTLAGATDAAFFLGSRMGRHHDAAAAARLAPQGHRGSRRACAPGCFPGD